MAIFRVAPLLRSPLSLTLRLGQPKFTKSLFVRYQALQQAEEQPSLDGSVRIISTATNKLLCHLTPDEADVYRHNTHLKQARPIGLRGAPLGGLTTIGNSCS